MIRWPLTLGFLAVLARSGSAQELEPRAYSASPVGVNFVVVGYSRSTGSVVIDPTLPVSDVSAHINGFSLGLGRTFGVMGRQGLLTAALPYAWGEAEGNVGEERQQVTRSGLSDLRAKVSLNLCGSRALSPEEFAKRHRERVLVGSSLTVTAPSGQYNSGKLINLGTNRWALKPEVGVSYAWQKFYFDLYLGGWFFVENSDFYPGGSTKQQDPLTALQAHVSYTIRRGMWLALDSTWYGGGAVSVDDGPSGSRVNNSPARRHPVAPHRRASIHEDRLQRGRLRPQRIELQDAGRGMAVPVVLSRRGPPPVFGLDTFLPRNDDEMRVRDDSRPTIDVLG